MYNIKIKMEPIEILFSSVFFGMGCIFLVVIGLITFNMAQKKNALDGETSVIKYTIKCHDDDGSELCAPTFEYIVDNVSYTCSSSTYTSSKNFDKYKNVYYDLNNPSDCLSDYDVSSSKFIALFLIIPLVFIIVGSNMFIAARKRINKLKKLNQVGVLYKNLPYRMTDSNVSVNGRNVLNIEVDFTFPDGTKRILHSRPVYSGETSDADGMVDLLLDPNDYSNYYIDFNIEQKY